MRGFWSNKIIIIFVIVTILLLLTMAYLTTNRDSLTPGENIVGSMLSPVQSLFSSIGGGISGFFQYFGDTKQLHNDNQALSVRVDNLENENRALHEYRTENERLRSLLGLRDDMTGVSMEACRVIAKDPGNWFKTFTIDKGSDSGIQVKQAVITSRGLVGHVTEVGNNWSHVVALIDSSSSVGCRISRTGDIAIAEGDLTLQNEGLMKMTYLSKGANVTVGDMIETSGIGGVYPNGLLIGKIREIRPDTHSVSQYAIVEPAVNFEQVIEVMVVKK